MMEKKKLNGKLHFDAFKWLQIDSLFSFIVPKCIHPSIELFRKCEQIFTMKKKELAANNNPKTTIQIMSTDSKTFKVIPLVT